MGCYPCALIPTTCLTLIPIQCAAPWLQHTPGSSRPALPDHHPPATKSPLTGRSKREQHVGVVSSHSGEQGSSSSATAPSGIIATQGDDSATTAPATAQATAQGGGQVEAHGVQAALHEAASGALAAWCDAQGVPGHEATRTASMVRLRRQSHTLTDLAGSHLTCTGYTWSHLNYTDHTLGHT